MNNVNKLMQLLRDNARADAEGATGHALRVEAAADSADAHIYVYDVIDAWWGASAAALVEALASVGDRHVHLHINSPGGDVFEARAMASAIVAHPARVTAHIDGVAASAATDLALAANEVRMTEGGLFMIHNSWTIAVGDKSELRSTADLLDKVDGQILADYARRTGASAEQVRAWMDAETWFTPQEALDAKFIDAIDTNTKRDDAGAAAARWNLAAYAHAPKLAAEPPPPAEDITARTAAQLQANRNRLRLLAAI